VDATEFCLSILESGDLAVKLAPAPRDLDVQKHDQRAPTAPPDRPVRSASLAMSGGAGRLPRPGQLGDPEARARCIARFAHHELMAVELFAWALLRWPDQPAALKRGWLRVLSEEQEHCRLYVERLGALGFSLADFRHSDYFWKHIPSIGTSSHGIVAFLCAVGLTFEQANLDFTPRYAQAFRAVGDAATARVCDLVHAEEIGHVALAATWVRRLTPGDADASPLDLVAAYEQAIPFPLSAARAKGRPFDLEARRRAGLEASFIEYVRSARSTVQLSNPAGDGVPGGATRRPPQ